MSRILWLCAWLGLSVTSLSAATYYTAATGGRDSRSCAMAQDISTPKQTIGSGARCLTPGDTLLVREGTYREALITPPIAGTSWANTVRIATYPGESVWMRPSGTDYVLGFGGSNQYIELDGINIDGSAVLHDTVNITDGHATNHAHHIRLMWMEVIGPVSKGIVGAPNGQAVLLTNFDGTAVGMNEFLYLRIHGGGGNDFDHAIYMGSGGNIVDHCDIYDFPGTGIALYNGYGQSIVGVTISNNTVHDGRRTAAGQRHWGIQAADGARDTRIFNNVVYGIPNDGASSVGLFAYAGGNAQLLNNTVYGNAGEGLVAEIYASGTTIRNNISFGNAGRDYRNSGAATVAANNLFGVNPMFVDAPRNFRLRAGSPAIRAGMTVTPATRDVDGTARSGASDIGAYEYQPSAVPSPPTGLRIVS